MAPVLVPSEQLAAFFADTGASVPLFAPRGQITFETALRVVMGFVRMADLQRPGGHVFVSPELRRLCDVNRVAPDNTVPLAHVVESVRRHLVAPS